MNYEKIEKSYIDYANDCKKLIKYSFFSHNDLDYIDISEDDSITEVVRKHRIKMINIKIEHTMRMIREIIKINQNLGLKIDLQQIIKIAVLYHDIGRLSQATWSNTYKDSIYKEYNKPFNNHGEEGSFIFLNNEFNVDKRFVPIIAKTIYYHQNYNINPKINYEFQSNVANIDIDKITGKLDLNEGEWQIASLIVQLVADTDQADILYQYLCTDSNMIKNYIPDKRTNSLFDLSKKWGISEEEIVKFNENNNDSKKIKIPIQNITSDKLEIPMYMKKMFYDNSWPQLKELMHDDNWNFISIIWWRLSHFLNNITFTSTLWNIEECKLLQKIFAKLPENVKPAVKEAFLYSEEILVNNRLEENKNNIYLCKKK